MRLSQIEIGAIVERRDPRDGALTIARRTPDTDSGRPTYVPVGDTPPAGTPGYVEDRPADDWTPAGMTDRLDAARDAARRAFYAGGPGSAAVGAAWTAAARTLAGDGRQVDETAAAEADAIVAGIVDRARTRGYDGPGWPRRPAGFVPGRRSRARLIDVWRRSGGAG